MTVTAHTVAHPDAESDVRETPRELFDKYNDRFRFTLDAAATHQNALCDRYFTLSGMWQRGENGPDGLNPWGIGQWPLKECGLTGSWRGERVWCNPPFSELDEWVYKAWRSQADLVCMLCPNDRMDRKWWHALVEPYRDGKDLGPWLRRENPSAPRADDQPSLYLLTENEEGRWNFTINGGKPILSKKTGKKTGAMFGVTMLIWGQT